MTLMQATAPSVPQVTERCDIARNDDGRRHARAVRVRIEGVCTIVKSYLAGISRKIKIGDRVKARFHTGEQATHTALDLYFELE